ncbi:TonB-dependent receptor [Sphingomonas gei]|uniref:TonB-dependent receptor n=1 Tax=Sphingomonas gei TaxID=1395960 RepID=A0A4S1X2M6_9SPHN|nr:TonB-dependent receptor [Sphingomonas gei]TGX49585.1 TonB-dependent receptor [Sphingomonas gei]
MITKYRYSLLMTAALIASPAAAQVVDQAAVEAGEAQEASQDIVVTGIRASLQASQNIKRGADGVVDAVSAEDVGKFPDSNVAEALQRITGVAIDRSGGEGRSITVRGLGPEYNTVLLNGRTVATDNAGREFSFDILAADVIQTAEVYKTVDPKTQSGGIGSVVNIKTFKPLDRPEGLSGTLSLAGQEDILRKKLGFETGGTASWSDGTSFGIALGGTYSERHSAIDSFSTSGYALRDGINPAIAGDTGNPGDIMVAAPATSSGLTPASLVAIPAGSRVQQEAVFNRGRETRKRLALNGALEVLPTDRLRISLDGLFARFEVENVNARQSNFFSPPYIDPKFDENGTAISFSRPGADFVARNPLIAGAVGQSQNDNVNNGSNSVAKTYATGANIAYDVTDRLKISVDGSWSKSTSEGDDYFLVLGELAPESPFVQAPTDKGISTVTNLGGLTDKSLQRLHYAGNGKYKRSDEIKEFRFDASWKLEKGPLRTLSVGALRSDREKSFFGFRQKDFSQYGLSYSSIGCLYCGYTVPFDTSIQNEYSFSGYLKGVEGADKAPPAMLVASAADIFRELNNPANLANSNYGRNNPAGLAALLANIGSSGLDPARGLWSQFRYPQGDSGVREKTFEAYLNTNWGGDFGGEMPWSANAGFRIAFTDATSSGFVVPVLQIRESAGDTGLVVIEGPSEFNSVSNDYVNFLPAFNLKLEPAKDMVLRFAYSKSVTRPTLTALGLNQDYGGRSNAPTSGGGNPLLQAYEANNFDVAYEWYYDRFSFLAITAFYKKLGNFIETSTLPVSRPILFPAGNGGRTQDEVINVTFQDTRQRNGLSGSLAGIEAALQKTVNSGPLKGLGGILNYTYVHSKRDNAPAGDLGFNGFTPHTANATVFYENGPISARIAYNYRSEFLVLAQGAYSEPQQREAFGQTDFTIGYIINREFQIFAEGVNVFSEDTRDFSRFKNRVLYYEATPPRYSIGIRGKF